jgi:single-stranded-DNA-specific exonuclease
MHKLWHVLAPPEPKVIAHLADTLGIRPELATLLAQRGIRSFDDAKAFFRPSLDELHDPFLMRDMDRAVNRLCEAVFNGEKILVYGDYDVDGTTSVALVYMFLKEFTQEVDYYIPDRYGEGYGISEKGVRHAAENGYSLVVALDCGIRAEQKMELANELGVDFIICDHHLPGPQLPKALAVLDPKRADCPYPFKELSGCGVGFKLLQGFCQQNTIPLGRLLNYLDLVVVSIGSDIVPITGENRVLAYYGLKKLNSLPVAGLKWLKEVSGRTRPLTITDVVFYLGPRINAAGRLAHARESVDLLIGQEDEKLQEFAKVLNERNIERRDFDQTITAEALELIASKFPDTRSTVLFAETWHKGVVGIVASRCVEKFYRPTIILTRHGQKAAGSARSVEGFDVHEAIGSCADLLDQYGGHQHAAGLSMPLENLEAFRLKFEEVVSATILPEQMNPRIVVDLKVDFDFISFKTLSILKQMEPFGPQNMAPVFWSDRVIVKNPVRVLKEEHLKMMVYQQGHSQGYDAIGFGLGDKAAMIEVGKPFELLYHLEENEFQGNKTIQLAVKDIRFGA